MDTQQPPELYDEDMASQDSAPISTPADSLVPAAVLAGKQALITTDIEMKDEQQNVHAPPSPAPSGDSQHASTTTLHHHLNRPSPSPMSAPSFSAGDHPETSIPSPASPSGADSLSADVDMDLPTVTPTSPTKHEHDDDEGGPDAMIDEDQRPAKRARTADVASVSVISFYHVLVVTIARHTGQCCQVHRNLARSRRRRRFVRSTCIVHRVLTALHIHMHSFMFASGAVVSIPFNQSKISFPNSCNCSPLHRLPLWCHRYQQWHLFHPPSKVTLHRPTRPCPLNSSSLPRA